MNNKAPLLKLLFMALIYILPNNIVAQDEDRVYYILYKIVNKTQGNTSEDSYRKDMIPASYSTEGYKKLKAARKKMWSNESTSVRTVKRKLAPLDRIVIIKYHFKNSSGKYSRIAMKKFSKKSSDYKITVSEITSKYLKGSMISDYYQKYEVLYDGIPFTNSTEDKKKIKESVKKAEGLGVRG